MAKKNEKHDEGTIDVAATLGKAENFVEKNKKALAIIVGGIVLVVGGFFAYQKFIAAPREEEAQNAMFQAQYYFERDSFNLALNGDGTAAGFLGVIDEFGGTDAANLAEHCAGICLLNTGKYDEAIEHLKEFSSDDIVVGAQNLGLIGDAYMEKNQVDDAIDYYKKAADKSDNNFTAPIYLMKAAGALEDQKKYKEALEIYERIKNDYYQTREGQESEKFIARAKILGNIQ